MKQKYKLKGWVVLSVYVAAIGAIIITLFLTAKVLKNSVYSNESLSYVYKGLLDEAIPVVSYDNKTIVKPYVNEDVKVSIGYYDKNDESTVQEGALILYQNTYMPNTGILYSSDSSFDILSVLDGTVSDIVADEILGNIVTIKHSNNLSTVYHSLNEVNVLVGDLIKQSDVIGTSGINQIDSSSENMLLFEVIYNGEYINPDTFYNMSLEDLS